MREFLCAGIFLPTPGTTIHRWLCYFSPLFSRRAGHLWKVWSTRTLWRTGPLQAIGLMAVAVRFHIRCL